MNFDLFSIFKLVPAAIIGLTVHEFAHAYTAYLLGDSTAKEDGRLSLNPLKSIDPLGFILIVTAGFGWAKPVTINPDNLKKKHRDEILISLAGPFSNLILGFLFFLIARILFFFSYFHSTHLGGEFVNLFGLWGVINLTLFFFNLIPIPPLDGSHLYMTFLKKVNAKVIGNLYKYGIVLLIVVLLIESQFQIEILPISKLVDAMTGFMVQLLGFGS
ncbi:MAG TPA: site-2 protease family protein [Spirochaetia bacterium]|nr:MAG: peptidase M50 [Spirochaetes bacterium GWB1_36_13]HCL57278.1 site-2 protease family protein [Spirochaetia bacterium]